MNFTRVKLDAQLLLLQVVVFWQTQPQVCRAKGILRGAHISGDASARLSGMMDQCDAQFPTWFGARNVPSSTTFLASHLLQVSSKEIVQRIGAYVTESIGFDFLGKV